MSKEVKYPTATLLKSKALSGYQKDFAGALLTKEEYSVGEARAVLERFFGGGNPPVGEADSPLSKGAKKDEGPAGQKKGCE